MSEESLLVVCPNPKCGKEFREPILLTVQSSKPPKNYEACPYCFSEVEHKHPKQKESSKPTPKKEEKPEPKKETAPATSEKTVTEKDDGSSPKLLSKVKSLIPANGSAKEKTESKDKSTDKKDRDSSGCPDTFGYLANRPKDAPIPQQCLSCPKMVDCMLSPREE